MIDHDPNFYIKRMTFPAAPIYFLQHSSRVNPYSIGGEVTVVQPAMGPGNTSRNEDVATDSLQLFRTFGSFPGARERREFPLAERRGPPRASDVRRTRGPAPHTIRPSCPCKSAAAKDAARIESANRSWR